MLTLDDCVGIVSTQAKLYARAKKADRQAILEKMRPHIELGAKLAREAAEKSAKLKEQLRSEMLARRVNNQ